MEHRSETRSGKCIPPGLTNPRRAINPLYFGKIVRRAGALNRIIFSSEKVLSDFAITTLSGRCCRPGHRLGDDFFARGGFFSIRTHLRDCIYPNLQRRSFIPSGQVAMGVRVSRDWRDVRLLHDRFLGRTEAAGAHIFFVMITFARSQNTGTAQVPDHLIFIRPLHHWQPANVMPQHSRDGVVQGFVGISDA